MVDLWFVGLFGVYAIGGRLVKVSLLLSGVTVDCVQKMKSKRLDRVFLNRLIYSFVRNSFTRVLLVVFFEHARSASDAVQPVAETK